MGLPVTARGVIPEPGASRAPAIAPSQIRRDGAFLEKDVLPHIPEGLPPAPAAPVRDDVRAVLFVGVDGFC